MGNNLIDNRFAERKKGRRWIPVERHCGGFRSYKGWDVMGEEHTVTVDERYAAIEHKCSECGKFSWNEMFPNFCSNFGAEMGSTIEEQPKKYRVAILRLPNHPKRFGPYLDDEDYSKYVDANSELWRPYVNGFSSVESAMTWIRQNAEQVGKYINKHIYPDTAAIRFEVEEV